MNRQIVHVLVAGAVLAATLTGCAAQPSASPSPGGDAASSGAPEHPSRPPESSAPADDAAAPAPGCTGDLPAGVTPVEVDVRFADGAAEPAPDRVEVPLGATVVLRAEADVPAEIHVHGYDVAAEAIPGEPACLEVVADTPGVYDVEAHPETLLLQLAVR